MLRTILEEVIIAVILAFIGCCGLEFITFEICKGTAEDYVIMCEDYTGLNIDADIYVERIGIMEYEYTIYSKGFSGILTNGHSDTVTMAEIINVVLLED